MTEPRLLITICTYNEKENVQRLITEIHGEAPDADVLVIDDNSPDGTGEIVDEMARTDARIHVLHREGKLGLGTATVAGFTFAIEHDYDVLLNMDADFSHHPRYIPALRDCVARADVGIGSRYIPGGGVTGWGPMRHVMSRCINWYARTLLGLPIRDASGAFRCYRVSKLSELDFHAIRSRGYAFQEEVLYLCQRVGCIFEETPIVFEDRRYGESKINMKEAVAALWILFRLGIERVFFRRRHRVSPPVS